MWAVEAMMEGMSLERLRFVALASLHTVNASGIACMIEKNKLTIYG